MFSLMTSSHSLGTSSETPSIDNSTRAASDVSLNTLLNAFFTADSPDTFYINTTILKVLISVSISRVQF